jgi:photosystem II stability/assembly factor-like uncharacterized protein
MRHFFFSIISAALLAAFIPHASRAQTLYRLNAGTKARLNAIAFPTDSLGVVIGDTLASTTDGGSSWMAANLGITFNAIFFNDSAHGAIVGDSGYIFLLGGSNNPPIQLPELKSIYAITFPSYDTAVIAGAQGLCYKSVDSGKSWTKLTLPLLDRSRDFHGVDYFDDSTYWLVGQGGIVLYTEDAGTTWQKIPVPSTKDLYSICFPDSTGAGWIVGDSTLLYTTDGGDDWTSVPTMARLRCVTGYDSLDAYTVGLNGVLLVTSNLSNWSPIPTGTTANLYGVDIPDSLYVCGDSGIVLSTFSPQPEFFVGNRFGEKGMNMSAPGGTLDSTSLINYNDAWIQNNSSLPVTIMSITIDSATSLMPDTNAYISIPAWFRSELPLTIPAGANIPLPIYFQPPEQSGFNEYDYIVNVISKEAGQQNFEVTAFASPSSAVHAAPPALQHELILSADGKHYSIFYSSDLSNNGKFELFNALGVQVFSSPMNINHLVANGLPPGAYFYRISGNKGISTGKFILE